jgi:tripartite-type tricarboxylate transporter receptor subunit TctC
VASGALWIGALLQNVPYDPIRDFAPISLTTRSPNILAVHPSLPAKSVKELIALAKAKSGELVYGSAGTGSSTHLSAELFKAMAGINILHVPFKGTGPALNALLGGHVQLIFSSTNSLAPHVTSGRLRALAVTSAQPSALATGLPTVAASGLPGYEFVSVDGVFAPSKTPAAIINRLNQEVVRFFNTPTVKEQFFSTGSEAVGSTPEEFAAAVKAEMTRLGKLIKDVGIKTE